MSLVTSVERDIWSTPSQFSYLISNRQLEFDDAKGMFEYEHQMVITIEFLKADRPKAITREDGECQ